MFGWIMIRVLGQKPREDFPPVDSIWKDPMRDFVAICFVNNERKVITISTTDLQEALEGIMVTYNIEARAIRSIYEIPRK